MLIVTSPVVEIAEVEIKRLSRKAISVLWNSGMDNKRKPTRVYKKKPQTKFSWGDLLIWNLLYLD